jgi:hypothetical protein
MHINLHKDITAYEGTAEAAKIVFEARFKEPMTVIPSVMARTNKNHDPGTICTSDWVTYRFDAQARNVRDRRFNDVTFTVGVDNMLDPLLVLDELPTYYLYFFSTGANYTDPKEIFLLDYKKMYGLVQQHPKYWGRRPGNFNGIYLPYWEKNHCILEHINL